MYNIVTFFSISCILSFSSQSVAGTTATATATTAANTVAATAATVADAAAADATGGVHFSIEFVTRLKH